MGDAEKVIETVEELSGSTVSVPTIIAGVLAVIAILLWAHKQIWPIIKEKFEKSVNDRVEENTQHEKLESVAKKQEEHDKQFDEIMEMIKNLGTSMETVSNQLSGISGENKLTLSVLLDMIECMQAKTSPEECAKRAQSSINTYYREGKLPTAVIN